MKLGTNDIGSVYLGTNAVQKVYLGTNEVWTSFTGLLDTYTGAAAAYSLRRLSGSYSGSAVRVRRASDNTEQDIGFVNNVLDTSALTTFCSGTDGFVKTWYDQSGNSRDATQVTAANQPQIVSSGSVILENGKPSINFIGANLTYLQSISEFRFITGFTLVRFYTRPSFAYIAYINNPPSNIPYLIGDVLASGYRINAGTSLSTGIVPSTTSQNLIYSLFDNINSEISVNNGTIFTGNTGTNYPIGELTIGLVPFNSGSAFNGTMQEMIFYNVDESSNVSSINTNINDYYSIY